MNNKDIPVLHVNEIKLGKRTFPFSSMDTAFSLKTEEEDMHGSEKCTYTCNLKIGPVEKKFIQIGTDKTVVRLYCHHKTLLRENDRIVAVNNNSVIEMSAEDVANVFNSYCQRSDNSQIREFILTIHRTESQYIEEVNILFRVMAIHARSANRSTRTSESPHPNAYMRDVIRTVDKRTKKDIIIKTKLCRGEQQYLTVSNGRLCTDFITSADQRDQYAFTMRQYTVIYRSDNGKEKVRLAYTIWWNDQCLVGSINGELKFQMHNNEAPPISDSLFRMRRTTTGCAFESIKYMYYYIHFNPRDNTVSFERKRPINCHGQTRKTSPPDCKFDITYLKMLSSDDDTRSVFCALKQPFLFCLKPKA